MAARTSRRAAAHYHNLKIYKLEKKLSKCQNEVDLICIIRYQRTDKRRFKLNNAN